jgi:hypothetical protein
MIQIVSYDAISNIPADCRRNPRLPAVSLPLAGGLTPTLPDFGSKSISVVTNVTPETVKGKDGKTTVQRELSTVPNGTVDLPATIIGKDGKEYSATKQKAQTLITSTTVVIAISTTASGNNRLKPSLYTAQAFKTGISELATAYNRFLGALARRVGQLFPISEASA